MTDKAVSGSVRKTDRVKKGGNYDIFKQQAMERFLTFEQQPLIDRLQPEIDEEYIYVPFCARQYRIGRTRPVCEYLKAESVDEKGSCQGEGEWVEASCNAVLTICDLLCHTTDPIILTGSFRSVESLNRVKGGSTTILGEGFNKKTEHFLDHRDADFSAACEKLAGVRQGKGDVAYRIPLYGPIDLLLSFYNSDEEFDAKLTLFFDEKICDFLHYETIYYAAGLVLDQIMDLMGKHGAA